MLARLKKLSQERLPGRQRQKAKNCLQATSRLDRDRTLPISTRKCPEFRGLRDSIRDFGDQVDCVVGPGGLEPPTRPL
jgi:hypothetical protein